MMCVVVRDVESGQYHSFVKGAPEVILKLCKNITNKELIGKLTKFSGQGLRLLGLAYKSMNIESTEGLLRKEFESNLDFLGVALFENGIKENTKESIPLFLAADIDCKIITGDNQVTAMAVGDQCGFFNRTSKIVEVDYNQESLTLEINIYNSLYLKKQGIMA